MTYRKSLLAGLVLAPLGLMVSGPVFAENVSTPLTQKVLQVAESEQNEQGNAESQDGNQDEGNAETNDGNQDEGNAENNEGGNEQADNENDGENEGENCGKKCPESNENGENNN